ncbi:hypothetical protein [Caballeronia sp. DA-9]|uniref:hypothetical protein n=1 Tax=Caballeronia sp. DA-9 TaxID=3436237 RepID=UPI003F67888B
MAITPSSKESRSAKSRAKQEEAARGIALPLVVDPTNLSVMSVERLDPHNAEQLLVHADQSADAAVSHAQRKNRIAIRPTAGVLLVYDLPTQKATLRGRPARVNRDAAPHLDEALFRSVFEKTLESVKEVHQQQAGELTAGQFIRQVAETLAVKADAGAQQVPVEQGWQELLESGLRSKASLWSSAEFKTTSEAGKLLGIKEAAVRKRIREQKLFALKTSADGEHRIPAWALDPRLAGAPTAALLAEAGSADEWHLYHFLSTPNGGLNGLRPFECLISRENLPLPRQALRDELAAYLGLSPGASLLETVKQAWVSELTEGQEA